MTSFEIVAIGEPLYELNQQPDARYLPGFGGDTLNVAIAASRLGTHSAYITRLGSDLFGDELLDLMIRERIDVSAVTRVQTAPTGLYFVNHGPNGHVFTYRRAGSAASLMTAGDIDKDMIANSRFLHASGISQAISASAAGAVSAAIDLARASGVAISYDTNFRSRLWSAGDAWPTICAAAARADILKTSAEDCAALIGLADPAAIAAHFRSLGAKAVVVTLGADGAHLATNGISEMVRGYRVAAVDATGAGDAFTGAMLSEMVAGAALPDAVRFANAAAALSTLGYGAIAPLPARSDVQAFITSNG